jgi:hypothetical protein
MEDTFNPTVHYNLRDDSTKQYNFDLAKSHCKDCEGSGQILWNGSYYSCAHNLSLADRTLSTGQIL